jgi:hypothetical protein
VVRSSEDAAMTRLVPGFIALCVILLLTGLCAIGSSDGTVGARVTFWWIPAMPAVSPIPTGPGPGYGPGYGIGYGPGYWGHPLGYYGGPYGPLGFGLVWWVWRFGAAARPPSGTPGVRPTPPAHAPPQFRKKL